MMDLDGLTLAEIPATAWALLAEGATRAASPLHTVVVASQGDDGPDARTVVLREADAASGAVVFHTDRRSPKTAQLVRRPPVTCLFYDRDRKLQLRLHGSATLHTDDDLAQRRWEASRLRSRQCYRHADPPGALLSAEPTPLGESPILIEADGRENFAAVHVQVTRFEWLYLRAAGHRRARFERREDGGWVGAWIAP